LRVVNRDWGPRGVPESLRRIAAGGFSPALVFDIGASNGQWTRECLGIFPQARYVVADPLEKNWSSLAQLAQEHPRVFVWEGAVGPATGSLDIHCHGDQSSALASRELTGPTRTVPMQTVDSLFAGQREAAPVFLKADVQGYELEVLRGASQCLKNSELLLLEVSFRRLYDNCALAHQIIAYLAERKFCIYDICSYVQRPLDGELAQSDFLFVHESSQMFATHGWSIR
jgi:FkbM family methyltransferase